ncbi:hypothetical protein SAMN05444392_111102 [Seinonella peptonophila]|uniref:Uncharacterized protein n=1 Tax=Seinonella peptonophila TaxID=112248 RepID=A0A1M5A1X5_9BACL|nr:hypothetical protein SAMN05444392_111102 [Seinonella peptonophila]
MQLVVVVVITALGVEGNAILTLLIGLATSVVILGYIWVVQRTERQAPLEMERKGAVAAVGIGTMIGLVLFGAVILNLFFLEYYTVSGLGSPIGALGPFGMLTAAAVTEEVMFVGFCSGYSRSGRALGSHL